MAISQKIIKLIKETEWIDESKISSAQPIEISLTMALIEEVERLRGVVAQQSHLLSKLIKVTKVEIEE
jgi:hypothetical protein